MPARARAHWRAPLAGEQVPAACQDWLDAQKTTIAASQPDQGRRCGFGLQMLQHAASQFVSGDQSGSKVTLPPGYAPAPPAQPAQPQVRPNLPATTTVIAALTSGGMRATMLVEGATDHHVVEASSEPLLLPPLRPGQVVVLDTVSAHKPAEIEALLAAVGCQLWFVRPYSAALAPIELAFAKIKPAVRRANARTSEALSAAIAQALWLVSASDAQGLFAHCGFLSDPASAQLI